MPEDIRKAISVPKEPFKKQVAQQKISQCFASTERSQEDADDLLGMAWIAGDIPYM